MSVASLSKISLLLHTMAHKEDFGISGVDETVFSAIHK